MANHKSAKKRIRRNQKVELINKVIKSRVRTFVKKVETAILSNNKNAAIEALKIAQPEMHKSVSKKTFKKNTISRKISRLSKKIKLIDA